MGKEPKMKIDFLKVKGNRQLSKKVKHIKLKGKTVWK